METEEEVLKPKNKHFPAVMLERQKQAEALLLREMKQESNGQYQTRLVWRSDARPHNNYAAAKTAHQRWEERLQKDHKLNESFHYSMRQWISCDYLELFDNKPDSNQNFLTGFMV